MRISDWSSDVCSSDLRQKAVVAEQQRQVDALTIRAPFNGQVGQVHVPQGTSVVANGPVLSVVDLDKFEVEIKVPESFARDLGIGIPAPVTSNGKTYKAEVSAVSPEVVNGKVNADRKRVGQGKSGAVRVDRGGRRISTKTNSNYIDTSQ